MGWQVKIHLIIGHRKTRKWVMICIYQSKETKEIIFPLITYLIQKTKMITYSHFHSINILLSLWCSLIETITHNQSIIETITHNQFTILLILLIFFLVRCFSYIIPMYLGCALWLFNIIRLPINKNSHNQLTLAGHLHSEVLINVLYFN